jgi:glycosyltransferase involved in cell wall biosynthesis
VLEALSSGATAICTTAGSLSEFVTDGKDSLILKSPQPTDIADGLRRVLALDTFDDLPRQAHSLWNKHFDASKTTLNLANNWRDAAQID